MQHTRMGSRCIARCIPGAATRVWCCCCRMSNVHDVIGHQVRLRSSPDCGPQPPPEHDLNLPFIEAHFIAAPADPGGCNCEHDKVH